MDQTQASGAAPQGWRYRVGLTLFVIGNAIVVSSPLLPMLGVDVGIAAAIIVAGEVAATGSIFFLGKEGFKRLKAKLFRFLRPPEGPISRTRHRIGVGLLLFNTVAIYAALTLVLVAYSRTTVENPFPIVFGLGFEGQGATFLALIFGGGAAFIASFYVLGAEWLDRFKQLFQYQAEVQTAG